MLLASSEELSKFAATARERRWGLALLILGWWHLASFLACYYLTAVVDYHGSLGYLAIWLGELCGLGLIFRLCGGPRPATCPATALELWVRRVRIAYFVLAFNLGSLNTLRGHAMYEFFPAIASLASFAFLMLSFVLDRRFYIATLAMFASGLLMAAFFQHAYLIFAVAWWGVLECIGLTLMRPSFISIRWTPARRTEAEMR